MRGIVLKTYREVLRERFGEGGLGDVAGALEPETRDLFGSMIIATEWYPNRHIVNLYETIVRVHYGGQPEGIRELGRISAKRDLRGVFKIFVVVVSPQYLVSKTASVWSRYFDHGRVQIMDQRRGFCRGKFFDVLSYSTAFWHEILGSCIGAIEAAGGKNVVVQIVSGGTAKDSTMESEIRWE
ncbi:MAG: hypothetical protein L0206_20525 [Actinobacteria bacterium]|nr:hypothetical protein [Actinomycetota bacterium]